jgi:hypothetical protein
MLRNTRFTLPCGIGDHCPSLEFRPGIRDVVLYPQRMLFWPRFLQQKTTYNSQSYDRERLNWVARDLICAAY